VAPAAPATELKVNAVTKNEGRKLKSSIQGFDQSINTIAGARRPVTDASRALLEADQARITELRKGRELMLEEKERKAKEERLLELRERRERKEESMRREIELQTRLKREQREAERRLQIEQAAQARQLEAEARQREKQRAKEEEKAAKQASNDSPAQEKVPTAPKQAETPVPQEAKVAVAKQADAAVPVPPRPGAGQAPAKQAADDKGASPATPPVRPTASDQPKAPAAAVAATGTPTPKGAKVPEPDNRARSDMPPPQRPPLSRPAVPPPRATLRKFATPVNGVQFAKGYQENGVTPLPSTFIQAHGFT
jgi:hypothetical protein